MTTRGRACTPHLELFDSRDWGLIIYDEVHLLPAPIFRFTADIQSRRRLGLTATLVREDGREGDVFSLIGPKRYDAPWKDIEAQGWIAPADCVEVRVTLPDRERLAVRHRRARGALPPRARRRTARSGWSRRWSPRHADDQVLVIGQYLDQLDGSRRAPRRPRHHRRDAGQGARAAVPGLPRRRDPAAGREQGRELLGRPAGGRRRHPGLGHRSARGRRRRSGSGGSCGPRPTAARRASTPS